MKKKSTETNRPSVTENNAAPWAIAPEEILQKEGLTKEGLSTQRAEEIRKEKGENVLAEGKKKSILLDSSGSPDSDGARQGQLLQLA